MLVSHDTHLVKMVADQLWVVEKGTVQPFEGDIDEYQTKLLRDRSSRPAKEGKANNVLDEDRSVASGRTMDQIAAGKGNAPKPFMTARAKRASADAVWHSNRGDDVISRPAPAKEPKGKKVAAMPDFVAPELCTSVERPPNGEGWCHEIKFDGYRVQLRVEDGDARLKPARASTGPTNSRPSPGKAARSPMR